MLTGHLSRTLIGRVADCDAAHMRGVDEMPYARTDVRTALHAAREAGKPCDGLIAGDRETALQLERWGFLPVDQAALLAVQLY